MKILLVLFFLSSRMPTSNSTPNSCILLTGASKHSKISVAIKFKTVHILSSLMTLMASSSFISLPLTVADLQAALWLPADVQPNLEPSQANCISERRYVSDLSLVPAHH